MVHVCWALGCAGWGSACPAPLIAHRACHRAGFQLLPALSSPALDLVSYHSSGLRLGLCSFCEGRAGGRGGGDLTSELVTETGTDLGGRTGQGWAL